MSNWGFVGAGHISTKVARELIKQGNQTIYGVWNRSSDRANVFVSSFGCKSYGNVDEMLDDPSIDIIYIGLTNEQHYPYVLKCIEHKKAYLCEKPFAGNMKEAEEMVRLTKEANLFGAEAMWTWFNKPAMYVKESLKEIGAIKEVNYVFLPDMGDYTKIKRLMDVSLYGGALMDLGVYPVRYIYELFGMPKQVVATGSLINGVDKHAFIKFEYDGFVANIETGMDEYRGENLDIAGEHGTLHAPLAHMGKEAFVTINGQTKHFVDESLKYANMFDSVAKRYEGGEKESIVSLQSTLEVMSLLDEIRKQLNVIFPCD